MRKTSNSNTEEKNKKHQVIYNIRQNKQILTKIDNILSFELRFELARERGLSSEFNNLETTTLKDLLRGREAIPRDGEKARVRGL